MTSSLEIRQNNNSLIFDIKTKEVCFDDFDVSFETIKNCDLSKNILINMQKVKNLDNEFVNYFNNLSKTFKECEICFYELDPFINSLFYIFQLDKLYEIYNSEDDAIQKQKPLVRRRFSVV